MGARQELADEFKEKLPPKKYNVIAEPRELDTLSQPTLQIIRTEIELAPNVQGNFKETFQLWVLTPKQIQPAAEDDLENLLFDVLPIIDKSKLISAWTKATRAIHVSQAHGYRIDVTVYTEKEY